MDIVLGLIMKPESLVPVTCFALEKAIDELNEGFGVLGFQFLREKRFFRVKLQKYESVEKMSELCVIDIYIYSEFVKSFHIQRGQNRQLINDKNRGREKICLKAYNHHCP